MNTTAEKSENELKQYVVQIHALDDPATASWVPYNEDKVDGSRFFITDQLPTGDYKLLQLVSLSATYSTNYITVCLCGVTTEQIVQGREDGEQYIFPGLDRILIFAQQEVHFLIYSLDNTRWLLKEQFIGSYAAILENQLVKIRDLSERSLPLSIHLVDSILTVL